MIKPFETSLKAASFAKRRLGVGVAVVALIGLAAYFGPHKTAGGSSCTVSLASFGALKIDMSQTEVQSVFGCPGVEMSRSRIADQEIVMLRWSAGPASIATASFNNDRLWAKNQFGLE